MKIIFIRKRKFSKLFLKVLITLASFHFATAQAIAGCNPEQNFGQTYRGDDGTISIYENSINGDFNLGDEIYRQRIVFNTNHACFGPDDVFELRLRFLIDPTISKKRPVLKSALFFNNIELRDWRVWMDFANYNAKGYATFTSKVKKNGMIYHLGQVLLSVSSISDNFSKIKITSQNKTEKFPVSISLPYPKTSRIYIYHY